MLLVALLFKIERDMYLPVRLIGNGGCGGHPQNEVRKIQVPRVKVAKNTSPCHILGFYTVVKVASFVPPTSPRVGKPT